jgi:hypothetical protein
MSNSLIFTLVFGVLFFYNSECDEEGSEIITSHANTNICREIIGSPCSKYAHQHDLHLHQKNVQQIFSMDEDFLLSTILQCGRWNRTQSSDLWD